MTRAYWRTVGIGVIGLLACGAVWMTVIGLAVAVDYSLRQVQLPSIGTPDEGLPVRTVIEASESSHLATEKPAYTAREAKARLVWSPSLTKDKCYAELTLQTGRIGFVGLPDDWCEGMR